MVQTKHQKSKPKKQPHSKGHGKQADISEFRAQLDALGLKIVQVTADGNCFFRALADQLEGNEDEHEKYRSMVVQHILKNREMFEPFIEDEVPFDEYCQAMEKDGTWAGHMEVQAASLVTRSNICIHRNLSPRWYVRNFDGRGARMIHLSYHDGEHYNSVRLKEDPCDGPARPITIKADADVSVASHQAKVAVSKSKGEPHQNIDAGSIKIVMAGTGCNNTEMVEQALIEVDGDIDAAIEFLLAEQENEECLVDINNNDSHSESSCGDVKNGNAKHQEEKLEISADSQVPSSYSVKQVHDNGKSQQDDKKIPRNKVCPCGSKKKYKACCGSVAGRPSIKFAVNKGMDTLKGQKERKHGKKGGMLKVASSNKADEAAPDLGALCI